MAFFNIALLSYIGVMQSACFGEFSKAVQSISTTSIFWQINNVYVPWGGDIVEHKSITM